MSFISMWMCVHMCVCLRYGLISKKATGLQLPWRDWIRNMENPQSIHHFLHTHTHTHTHTRTPCAWDWAREFFPMQPKPLVCLDWTVCVVWVGRKGFRQESPFQWKVGTVERFKEGNPFEVVLQTRNQEHSRWLSPSKSLRPLRFYLLGNAGEKPE